MSAEEVLALARRLAEALKTSDEHRRFGQARQAVEGNVAAQIMLRDYNGKRMEFQARQLMGQEVTGAQEEEFRKLTEIVMYNPTVRDYLYAEQEIITLVAAVQNLLAEAVDLNLGFDADAGKAGAKNGAETGAETGAEGKGAGDD